MRRSAVLKEKRFTVCINPGFISYASGVLEGAENRGRRLTTLFP